MGVLVKLIDALLFLLLLAIAFEKPLIEAQACLPGDLYPNILVDLRNWYARESGDYLMTEMPDFYVGIMWVELVFQWPLVLINLYGILTGKPWFNITCLSYGISLFTSMARAYAKALNATLFFSSATYNINVNKIFKFITAKLFDLPWTVERNLTIGEPIIDF